MKNIKFLLLIMLFTMFIGLKGVSASDSFYLQYDTYDGTNYNFSSSGTYTKDSDIGASSSSFYFFRYASTRGNASGNQIFCLDYDTEATAYYLYESQGDEQKSCAIIEALKAGAITESELDAASSSNQQTGSANYHKVQNVLWRYLKTYPLGSTSCTTTVGTAGTISASKASNTLSLSSDGTKWISKAITVTRSNVNYYMLSTSLTGAYLATNADGTGKITAPTTESTVYLVIPTTTTLSSDEITIKLEGGSNAVKTYSGYIEVFSAGSGHQRMGKIRGDVDTQYPDASVNVTFEVPGTVKIAKVDSNGDKIAGATLKVTIDGVEKETFTSTTDYKVYKDITSDSTVCVEEIIAPTGYIKNSNKVCGKAKYAETLTLTVKNDKTKVLISKLDASTKKEIKGATLSILDSDKKQIDLTKAKYANVEIIDGEFLEGKGISWTSKETATEIQGLPIGTYYLQEDLAPAGYDKTAEMVKIEVTEDGVTAKGSLTNSLKVEVPNTGINGWGYVLIGLNLVVIGSIIVYAVMRKRKKA